MSGEPRWRELPGSERRPLPGARRVGSSPPDEPLQVTVVLRPRTAAPPAPGVPLPRLSREELAERRGADPADVARVEDFARRHGLAVAEVSPERRSVVLSGSVRELAGAFGTELAVYEHEGTQYRGRTGPLRLPDDVVDAVEGVFGLDDRPQARPHIRRAGERPAAARGLTPAEVAGLYDFPDGPDGAGQTIALLEFGGGYSAADLRAYFAALGMRVPRITAVGVDGAANRPDGDPDGADGEVLLDVEVAGAAAPGARLVVYFAPNTERGFLDAITTAVHDTARAPSVISISWGGPEPAWTRQAMRSVDAALADAAALGVTVCCAAGDSGSGDGLWDGAAHVDFPASSPHVLACGGTHLVARDGRIVRETVWNEGDGGAATGGGVSAVFGVPRWQAAAGVPARPTARGRSRRGGRGVPDVAGVADPRTGYRVRVDGESDVVGGTSAVAPLWAALTARLDQALGRPLGLLNPALYLRAAPEGALRDITEGENGAWHAAPGWDPCTGLGSPIGTRLLEVLGRRA